MTEAVTAQDYFPLRLSMSRPLTTIVTHGVIHHTEGYFVVEKSPEGLSHLSKALSSMAVNNVAWYFIRCLILLFNLTI